MPPRRSTGAADGAEDAATTALSPLPLSVVLYIFSLLSVDTRLRCSEVCRGWRSVLLERSLWTRLDLSRASGVTVTAGDNDYEGRVATRRRWDSLLRCAAARAGGGLRSLHVNTDHVTPAALLEVAATNAGALRELHASAAPQSGFSVVEAEALCVAVPLLDVFATVLSCYAADMQAVRRALRNEAPFGPLRVLHLDATLHRVDEADVVAFAADVAAHATLTGLSLLHTRLNTVAALDAVVDAALARRVQKVHFYYCDFSPASAPALARLLGSDALTSLANEGGDVVGALAARVLAAALRANATLTSLTLDNAGVWHDPDAAAELLGALHGHTSLRVLDLGFNRVAADQAALLGALIAANAPALTELNVTMCWLGDDGLRPLFEALPHNTHLRALKCDGNQISDAFAADVLLPAVRANASLRKLHVGVEWAAAREAAQLVQRRN
jgi:hypothetical protein